MPRELSSWERKDLFKHERSEAFSRWRESSSSPRGGLRHGLPRSDSRRRASPGHGNQGGWRTSPEESVHDWPSQTIREDGSCRKAAFSGDLNYHRNQRDDTGQLCSPRNLQGGYPWNAGNRSPQTPGRQHNTDDNNRFQQEKRAIGNGLNPSQKFVGEGPLGSAESKTHKWSRPFSLSSRNAGLNNSRGLKGSDNIDSSETNVASTLKVVLPLSENASADVFSVASSEDAASRKKRRLDWGEGLAKFEKKKVEGPTANLSERDESSNRSVYPANENSEVEMVSVCPPPATPSSDAEKKIHQEQDMNCKSVKSSSDVNGLEHSHSLPKILPDKLSSNLEEMDVISMINLSSSMEDLLQSVGLDSTKSSSAVSTDMGRLCTWKHEVFKILEKTESEIDSLESELKLLVSDSGGSSVSTIQLVEDDVKRQQEDSAMDLMDKHDGSVAGVSLNANDDIHCHGIATSQFDSAVLKEGSPDVEEQKSTEEIDASQSQGKELSLLFGNCAQDTGSCSAADAKFCQMILDSNKETAKEASQVFSNLLQNDPVLKVKQNGPVSCENNSLRDRFARRKRFLKFKEKVIAFKFQAMRQSWLEDVSKLYLEEPPAKSGKKHEASLRVTLGGCQNNRFSARSHIPNSGNPSPGNLLSIAKNPKPYREALKMPALILDEREKNQCRFISSNGLVEDPKAFEKEKSVINPWTDQEKEAFLDLLATHGKDFRKISTFLEHKRTADCVEFYYKYHKSELFRTAKMILRSKKKKKGKLLSTKTYMKTNKAASMMEAQTQPKELFQSRVGVERQMSGVELLAEVCTSLYSDNLEEGSQDRSEQRAERATEKKLDKSRRMRNTSHWTDDEKSLFVWAVTRYGKDFKKISKCVKTRSRDQCRSFFGKARKCLGLDFVLQERNSSAVEEEVVQEPEYGVSDAKLPNQTDCQASNEEYEGFEEAPEINLAPHLGADSSPCSVFSLSSDLRVHSPIDLDEEEKPKLQGTSSHAVSLQEYTHSSLAKINEVAAGSKQSNDMNWVVSNSTNLDSHNCPRTTTQLQQQQHIPFVPRKCSEKASQSGGGGDIKLFGQILTLPKNDKHNSIIPKEEKIKVTENSAFVKFDRNNHPGLKNIPTSYGFWDGNRIASIQQQPFQESSSARTFSQESSIGVQPIFPSRELIDTWSRDISKVHPYFAIDVNQEKQLTENGVQSGISDPVAALNMHYARLRHGVSVVNLEGNNNCSNMDSKG